MASPPYGPLAHLQDHLGHVALLLKRYIGRFGHRMLQADGRLSDQYVSLKEATAYLAGNPGPIQTTRLSRVPQWPDQDEVAQELSDHLAAMEERRAVLTRRARTLPLEQLQTLFGLRPREVTLLVAAAAPSLSVDLARMFRFAWADFAVKAPSIGFLCELVADPPSETWSLVDAFHDDSPLVRHRLLTVAPNTQPGHSYLYRAVAVPDAVLHLLRGGLRPLTEVLGHEGFRFVTPGESVPRSEVVLPEVTWTRLAAGFKACMDRHKPLGLVLTGPRGVGGRTALTALAAEHRANVLEVDLEQSAVEEDPEAWLATVHREAALRRSVILLAGRAVWEKPALVKRLERPLRRLLEETGGVVAIRARHFPTGLASMESYLRTIPLGATAKVEQRLLWERCLDDQADEALVAMLVSRIDAQAGAIVETVARAQREAATQGHHDPLSLSQLMLAHGEYTSHRLTDIAEPFETSLQWEDLILPTELMETLDEILAQATHREKVFEAWGFRRKMSYGRGLSCLFAGPPGTGKTMTAGLMAKRLQRPLFRVDLSRVTSKWVGETEKNLARVFDEAERGQVILLFDEADSLFGSRTEVKSSNDRYANLEVNYLLQRMEAYDGITILTTNFEKSIDEAFKRRLRFRVDFPFPDAEARERLWRAMLPPEAPIAPHLDFGALAHNYDMSGGNIKNAVLRAAFYAARQGHAIAFDHLERAAAAEAREIGLLIRTR